jgi:hypothetical protein
MGELPGIAFLGNEIAEFRVFRIDVLKEHPEGVADVLVMLLTSSIFQTQKFVV